MLALAHPPESTRIGADQLLIRQQMKRVPSQGRTMDASDRTRKVTLYPKSSPEALALSVVVPVYNELDSIEPLVDSVRAALGSAIPWELVLVDDGSTDGSRERMREQAQLEPRLRIISLNGNHGQTAALSAGFQCARGSAVATLDADLQNDPRDLLEMLRVLGENDVQAVVGYRATRKDNLVRRLSSRIANAIRRSLTGDQLRDVGCSTKVFQREALQDLQLFNGMHRFLPILLKMHGGRVMEVPVAHHERQFGQSKYGISNRAFRAFADLLAVHWMQSRMLRFKVEELGQADSLSESPSYASSTTAKSSAEISSKPGLDTSDAASAAATPLQQQQDASALQGKSQ